MKNTKKNNNMLLTLVGGEIMRIIRICDLLGYTHVKNHYYITENGNVFSFYKNEWRAKAKRIKKKYYYVNMMTHESDKSKDFRVNRIVATAFCLNLYNSPVADHIDGNKLNNHYLNLQWVTHSQNTKFANGEMYRNQIDIYNLSDTFSLI